jgi:hypothetical protein
MKMLWFSLFLFAPMCVGGQNAAQDGMESLRSLLKAGTIRRVEILRIPDETMTRTSVRPEDLRSIASYKVIFNEGFESTFGSLLSETSFNRSSQNSDLRWGVLFYNASGEEVGSMFVDKFGENGVVNGEHVRFTSNLAMRLRQVVRGLH